MVSSYNPLESERGKPPFSRVLLVGLDGATFDVLNPLMHTGRMPNLKAMVAGGVSGYLESTRPPITPAAWTTFMTGKGPGKHGIIDFVRYDPTSHQLHFNDNNKINHNASTIWQILSEKNYKVGSINLPMTYPPEPVNGFMISGFDTPPGKAFTFPEELQGEILARYPDYTHEKKWQRKAFGGVDLFKENLGYISQSFDRGYELAQFCGGKYGWDVMMVLFKLVDNLQHKAWRYLDPNIKNRDPLRSEMAIECFVRLDHVLGKLREYARQHRATVVIMSDHGHGSLDGKAQPNLLLARWGYLTLRNTMSRAKTRGKVWWRRLTGNGRTMLVDTMRHLDRDLAIDWPQTQACVLHAGIYGFLYLNVRGRQPHGVVEPSRYESLRRDIRERLLGARCRDRQGREIAIFPEVHITEQLYGCNREEHPWMPDLLLAPAPGLAVVKKIRGSAPVRWIAPDRLEGTHRLEGIFVAEGPAAAVGRRIEGARIADIAPTILAGLGQRVPQDMEGKVLLDMFENPPTVEYEPPLGRKVDELESPELSKAQMEEVAQRLSNLGYLD